MSQDLKAFGDAYPAKTSAESWTSFRTNEKDSALHSCVSTKSRSSMTTYTSDEVASLSRSSVTSSSDLGNDVDPQEETIDPALVPSNGETKLIHLGRTDYEATQEQVDAQLLQDLAHSNEIITSLFMNDGKSPHPLLAPFIGAKQQNEPAETFWKWSVQRQRFYHADDHGNVVLWYPKTDSFA